MFRCSELSFDAECLGEPIRTLAQTCSVLARAAESATLTLMRAFLMMPFGDGLAWLHAEIVQAGESVGVEVQRADDVFAAGIIIDQIRERIATADAVVAVCTGRNANVFYELGIADQYHRPVLIAAGLDDLPFDVQHYRALLYGSDTPGQDRATLLERIRRALVDTIQARAERLNDYLAGVPVVAEVEATPIERPELDAAMLTSGENRLIEIRNTGTADMRHVSWDVADDAGWYLLDRDIPQSLDLLRPHEHFRFPVLITMGSQTAATITLTAETDSGDSYTRDRLLTIYG